MNKKKLFRKTLLLEPTSLHKNIINKSNYQDFKILSKQQQQQKQLKHQINTESICYIQNNIFIYKDPTLATTTTTTTTTTTHTCCNNNTSKHNTTIICTNQNYQILKKLLYISHKETLFGFSVRGGRDVGSVPHIANIRAGIGFFFFFQAFLFLNIQIQNTNIILMFIANRDWISKL